MLHRLMQAYQQPPTRIGRHCRPTVEQLECRLAPSVSATPAVTPSAAGPAVHSAKAAPADPQAILAIIAAVRGHADRVELVLPPPAGSAPPDKVPPPPSIDAPSPVPFDRTIIALPVESTVPPPAEVPVASSPFEEARIAEPGLPAHDPMPVERSAVVVVTAVEQEPEMEVPAASEFRAEPTRAPCIWLAERVVAPAESAAKQDHLPLLIWMLGMTGLVAMRAERRRAVDLACV
jgi:hypothetical protein